jgi:hypothetical protein
MNRLQRPLCVVHIGAPKTGTTFLQKLICDNRAVLLSQGWLYPEVSLRGWGHHDLAFLSAGGYPEWASPQPRALPELLGELRSAASTHRGPLLLSSENFFLCGKPQGLFDGLQQAGLFDSHEVRILVYLREQGAAHESWYNQTVKAQGYTHTAADCVRDSYALWDYELQLGAWASAFGAERLWVRLYEPGAFVGGSLQSDVAALIGAPLDELPVREAKVNSGLNRDALEFQRLINALPVSHAERRRFHKQLIELTARSSGSGLFAEAAVLDAITLSDLRAAYAPGNAAVAKRFFGREQLFPAPEPTPVSAPYPGLNQDALVRLLGWLMIQTADQR